LTYLTGSYHPGLVLLSIVVAMMASYTALNLAGRVTETEGRTSLLWLTGGAVAMGSGIWAMHFIGMLAFSLPVRMSYALDTTLLSLLVAIGVSAFALRIVTRPTLRARHFLVGGLLMGMGICGMHYMGMHAMRMDPAIHYDTTRLVASIVIAVVASIAALWLAFTLRAGHNLATEHYAAAVGGGLAAGRAHRRTGEVAEPRQSPAAPPGAA
jgi:NO-binding membrane sensor protein with MHYT domain